MSYKELLRDRILAPLGVTMTGITLHAAAGDDAALRPAARRPQRPDAEVALGG
jgi:CubicO group peptidase (beta-lactamase class C family)